MNLFSKCIVCSLTLIGIIGLHQNKFLFAEHNLTKEKLINYLVHKTD